jgi:Ser/Thr protein kinase RdoA (MazF antagonist)
VLKLKYLFSNESLAEMLLGNWTYDPESLHLFQYYRISSNAIYPFRSAGNGQFLRFAPQSEKLIENLLAELEFISYLKDCGYGVLEAVPSMEGKELVEAKTPWGEYYASVFKRVPGVQLQDAGLSDHVMFRYGEALGKLHQLSSTYSPVQTKRGSYRDVLDWIVDVLKAFPQETAAVAEARELTGYFSKLPVTPANYGLIHYDFELDNVFYDEAGDIISAIDFDDCMYHWYAMDIEQSLDSLAEEIDPEEFGLKKERFMEGYRSQFSLPDDGPSMAACRRFANLYGYARVLRSTAEQWEHEPEWLTGLRGRLHHSLVTRSARFGERLT